ncbi:MAG: thioredoxin domain-containing protein [Candidatus Helarchaeota archaeon]
MSSKNDKVLLEFFTSQHCLYCRTASKMIQKTKKKYGDKLQVQEIDIDTPNGQLLKQIYMVEGTPTIVLNRLVAFRGLPPGQEELEQKIQEYL